jgi:hypothetical protein
MNKCYQRFGVTLYIDRIHHYVDLEVWRFGVSFRWPALSLHYFGE